MPLLFLITAALLFASGGVFMKQSAGATILIPTLLFISLFGLGAVLQARAMQREEMGAVYVAVLGLEAAFATALSHFFLHEGLSSRHGVAILLIVSGVALLRTT